MTYFMVIELIALGVLRTQFEKISLPIEIDCILWIECLLSHYVEILHDLRANV